MSNIDIIEIIRGLCELGGNLGYGGWFMGWLVSGLFVGLVIHLVIGIFSDLFSNACSMVDEGALEILPSRYATSEVNVQEFTDGMASFGRR